MAKIYVASSWRNEVQSLAVEILRDLGHEVYDFKNPPHGEGGFHWSEVMEHYDRDNDRAPLEEYLASLYTDIAETGFASDFDAMKWADACVLVLPCGRSAHLEMGWMTGQRKKTCIVMDGEDGFVTPELMYKMTDVVVPGLGAMSNWARALR